MKITIPRDGDLARAKTHEPESDYPTMIEIVAWWGEGGRKGRRKSVEIPADQFFGRGTYGAPLSGEQIIGLVNQLRKKS